MAGSLYFPGLAFVPNDFTRCRLKPFYKRQSGGGGHDPVRPASESAISNTKQLALPTFRQMPQGNEHQPIPINLELTGSCDQPPEGQGQRSEEDDKDHLEREVEELNDIIRRLQEFDDWLQREGAQIQALIRRNQENQPDQYNYENDENIIWLQRVADDRAWIQGELADFSLYITNRLQNELVGRCWIQRVADDKAWLQREIAEIYDYITEQQENDPALETVGESATPVDMQSPEQVPIEISQPFTQQPILGLTQLPQPFVSPPVSSYKYNDEYDETRLQIEVAEINDTIRQLREFDAFIKREDSEINAEITKRQPTKYNQHGNDDEAFRNEIWLKRVRDYKVWLHRRQEEYSALIGQLQQREHSVLAALAEGRAAKRHMPIKVSELFKDIVEQSLAGATEVPEPNLKQTVDHDQHDDKSVLQTELDTLNDIVKQLHEFDTWLQREDAIIRYHQQNDEDDDNEDWLERAVFDRVWIQEEKADFILYIQSLQQNEPIDPCWMERAVDDRAWLQREVQEFYEHFIKRQQNERAFETRTLVQNTIPEQTQTPISFPAGTPQHFVHHVHTFLKV